MAESNQHLKDQLFNGAANYKPKTLTEQEEPPKRRNVAFFGDQEQKVEESK